MSLKVYQVSEKVAMMFLNQLKYAKGLSQTTYDELCENYRIKTSYVVVKSRGAWLKFAADLMELLIQQFSKMDISSPGALCLGRMSNPTREQCPICYEDVVENCVIARMLCKHIFHEHCLLGWLKSSCSMSNYCPKCRSIIDDGRQITVTIYDKDKYIQI